MAETVIIPNMERDGFRGFEEWRRKLKVENDTITDHIADTTIHFTEASIDHSDIDELEWSLAGHTIDTDVDIAGFDLEDVGKLEVDSIAAADGVGPIVIDHDFNLSDNNIINIDSLLAGSGVSGILTLGGTGGTNNEDMTIDFETTANEILVSTSTSSSLIKYDSFDIEISKADPTITFTDTGDSNSATITRSDTSAVFQVSNTVLQPAGANKALDFDGTNDSVNFGSDGSLKPGTGDFSVSCWIKTSSGGSVIMGDRQQSGGGDTSWAIRLQAAGGVDVFLEDLGASAFLIKSSGAVKINNGAWRHLAFTWKISTQTLKIYIDNVDVTTASSGSGTIANITSGDDMLIGEYVGLSGDFTGVIDEVGIWAEELSVNKISDLYNGGDGLFIDTANNWPTDGGSIGTNIGAIWHFNETAMNQAPGGTDVEDTSGNGNHGTASASMTDADFVTGKVAPGGADVEASILKSEDGLNASEKGIITVGGDDGRLVLKGGDVADTGIRFNLDSTEAAKFDAATKTLIVDNGITTSQQIIARAADSASENIFEAQDSSFNILMNIEPDGEIAIPQDSKAIKLGVDGDATFLFDGNSLNIVANAVTNDDTMEFTAFSYTFRTLANTDIPMNFAGTSNSGLFTWMEDEDYFAFSDDILMNTSEKQYFRDTAIGIYSQADTFMDLFADGGVRIGDSSAGAPTNYVEIESDGDVNYVAGAGQQFGEIYYHGAGFDTALAAQDTFYQILGFDTNGESNGSVTPDHTNDHITVGKAGRYLVTCSIAARSAASNKYDFHVKYNNGASDCANLTTHRHTTTANRVGSMSISGIFDFPASATVELWVQRSDGGAVSKTITIESVTLSVVQIGGTT